jgi:AcrR family transcriptional regulator
MPKVRQAQAKPSDADLRRARRERRRDRTREEILEAARQVLIEEGVAATTLDAVARAAGMSKTGLYYYYPSKDAILFELVFGVLAREAKANHDAVEATGDGPSALRALIETTFSGFAESLDDFRLAFLHAQVAGPGAVQLSAEQFARIRPLNDLCLAGVAERVADTTIKRSKPEAQVAPRMLAFLAYASVIGLLTFKGMVESLDDPLLYSDAELVEGLARVFGRAAA